MRVMGNMQPSLLYFNLSGFGIVAVEPCEPYQPSRVMNESSTEWKYILLTRRVISYPIVVKTIIEHSRKATWFTRIYFYEVRDRPIDMLLRILDSKTILICSSRPEPAKIMQRMVANPRYSCAVTLLARIEDIEPKYSVEWVSRLARIARRLYLELSPIVYGRRMGRLVALKLRESVEAMNITICVSREGVSTSFTHGGLNVEIRGYESCLK
jgi:hypothetical protein